MDTCSPVSGVQLLKKTQAWRLEVGILYHTLRELRVVHYSKNVVVLHQVTDTVIWKPTESLEESENTEFSNKRSTILEMGKEIMQEE